MELDASPRSLEEHPYVALGNNEGDGLHADSTAGAVRRRSTLRGMRRRSLIDTPFFEADEAADLILKANAPPKTTDGSLDEIITNVRATKYCHEQFAKIQGQTGMSPTTLRFSPDYELGYRLFIQRAAIARTRLCFILGFTATFGYFLWNVHRAQYTPTMHFLAFGVGVSSFGLGLIFTYVPWMALQMELLTTVVFSSLALVLIALKPLQAQRGPVLPLLLLIIPIFGVTRMRFMHSVVLAWAIVFTYIVVQLLSMQALGPDWDTRADIFYQSINYGIATISGMVSHYRQELLRRRNYALKLPFTGRLMMPGEQDCSDALQQDKFSSKRLMRSWSMEFRHVEVEACFIRHWYLIDPFPFENPNAAVLHQGAFRTIRFPVMTLLLNQCFLAIQDYRLLTPFPPLPEIGYILRLGVVDVAYLSAALVMYVMGKRYYAHWLGATATAASPRHAFSAKMRRQHEPSSGGDWWTPHKHPYTPVATSDAMSATEVSSEHLLSATSLDDRRHDETMNVQWTDVHYAQHTAAIVVGIHGICMAAMMLLVANGPRGYADMYLMGFLNAIVFAHRSGFRVRHKFAMAATTLVGVGTVCVASVYLQGDLWVRNAAYISVVLVLAGLISREEEHLRRSFFILKSIRSLEFQEWFTQVTRVQDWIRVRLHQKCDAVRAKHAHPPPPKPPVLINTGKYLSQASKMGVYGEMVHVVLILIDVSIHFTS
ncbi:Aste57867_18612 [Aphanomyces stellatus]|uniref:Aste57867_18612 protein n=1 Tax=Aphanomyces stellatus TaxID=120398 RepID=A0A485LC25_9STRA|nr:hypothetical protein As57867_018550 [Aphanomyces stellatus]VFT95347.1 Aste57867_18612 [Aphanomyces stellatus]